jgi:hypothetical protein
MFNNEDVTVPFFFAAKHRTFVDRPRGSVSRGDENDGIGKLEGDAGVGKFIHEDASDTHIDDTGRGDWLWDPYVHKKVVDGGDFPNTVIVRHGDRASSVAACCIEIAIGEAWVSLMIIL